MCKRLLGFLLPPKLRQDKAEPDVALSGRMRWQILRQLTRHPDHGIAIHDHRLLHARLGFGGIA